MLNEAGKVVERKMQTIAISITSCDKECARCDNIAFENYLMHSGLGFTRTERESFWFASIGCGECPLGKQKTAFPSNIVGTSEYKM